MKNRNCLIIRSWTFLKGHTRGQTARLCLPGELCCRLLKWPPNVCSIFLPQMQLYTFINMFHLISAISKEMPLWMHGNTKLLSCEETISLYLAARRIINRCPHFLSQNTQHFQDKNKWKLSLLLAFCVLCRFYGVLKCFIFFALHSFQTNMFLLNARLRIHKVPREI